MRGAGHLGTRGRIRLTTMNNPGTWAPLSGSLDFSTLRELYLARAITVAEVVSAVYARIEASGDGGVWIHLLPKAQALARARGLDEQLKASDKTVHEMPLFGLPFAIKDNIDLKGEPTTAGCPAYAYIPSASAPVVERLIRAGAIPIGKTNMDQFAAGLSGVRSPYGACQNPFDKEYISGGSSSGSAVAVAAGLVSFSVGTDTAGSGRVPAAFNNIIGLKPTHGLLSTRGVVPACRSIDCVSVFALTCQDAQLTASTAQGFDPADFYSRECADNYHLHGKEPLESFRFGVPAREEMNFFGDEEACELFELSVERMRKIGGNAVRVSYAPFKEAADLLYNGPWLAERLAALKPFLDKNPEAVHPVTREILQKGSQYSAVHVFEAQARLEALKLQAQAEWKKMDLLLLPTTGTIYTIKEIQNNPMILNANLGYYTNFVNLLDCCAMAIPSGFRKNGLPFGISIVAPALNDHLLCAIGGRYHAELNGPLGATASFLPAEKKRAESLPVHPVHPVLSGEDKLVPVAVVGAHLQGQPLNHQLTSLNARLVRLCKTKQSYRLFALPGTKPPKPGLAFVSEGGSAIEVEVWELSTANFGYFTANVPPPLAIGTIHLDNGEAVKGFVCEGYALIGARDITSFGGWRNFLAGAAAV